jgi:hypothetical protein
MRYHPRLSARGRGESSAAVLILPAANRGVCTKACSLKPTSQTKAAIFLYVRLTAIVHVKCEPSTSSPKSTLIVDGNILLPSSTYCSPDAEKRLLHNQVRERISMQHTHGRCNLMTEGGIWC